MQAPNLLPPTLDTSSHHVTNPPEIPKTGQKRGFMGKDSNKLRGTEWGQLYAANKQLSLPSPT